MTRREWLSQASAIAGAGLLATSAPTTRAAAASSQADGPIQGGSLTWAVDILTNTLPYGAIGQSWTHVLTYDSLIEWDSNLVEQPGLAESWEAIDDQTYVFNLREGVLFHNGKELEAEDVKYSFELHRDPPPPGQSFAFYPKIGLCLDKLICP